MGSTVPRALAFVLAAVAHNADDGGVIHDDRVRHNPVVDRWQHDTVDHRDESLLLRYRLVETLVPLAVAAAEQIAYFDRTRSDTDDLVNDFAGWAIYWTPRLEREGLIAPALGVALRDIEGRLKAMTNRRDTSLWTDEALTNGSDWREIRELAGAALDAFRAMGVPVPAITDPLLKPLDAAPDPIAGE
jgi:hypothetical protein